MASLQETVDALAEASGRPIDVEDRGFRLLAHSAHDAPVDAVRRDTILRRAASPAVVARLERLGLARATAPVRLPAAPELGMGPRLVLPVRDAGQLLGYVWVLDDPPLADADVARLVAAALPVCVALAALRDMEDQRRSAEQHGLEQLLGAGDPVAATRLLSGRGPVTVAVAPEGSDLSPLRRRAAPGTMLLGTFAGRAVIVLGDGATPQTTLTLGVGAARTSLAEAPASHREAVLALLVAQAVPALGPVAHFADLGAHGLLAPLAFPTDGSPPAALPAAVETLGAAPDGPELLATLRAVLDAGEDTAGAAARLHVHRSTLHRRLRRIEQLTQTSLADGRTRLELHAGLVLAELRLPPAG